MLLKFTKMHGLGNDFMVVDGVTQKVFFSTDLIKKLSDRHFGIGFDQLLLVEPLLTLRLIFITESLMQTVLRYRCAATEQDALFVS